MREPGAVPSGSEPSTDDPSRAFLGGLVLLTFVMNVLGRGITETFAVFLLPVEEALGVDRATISATYSIFMISYGVAAPFAGQFIDRVGARACYTTGLLSLALGYWLAGQAETIALYYFGVGVLGGIGTASLGMAAASSLLSRWFSARLGTAAGVPYAAVGFGMLLFPPLVQVLLRSYDWRTVHHILAAIALAAVVLVVVFPLSRYSRGSGEWQAARASAQASGAGVWTVSTAIRTRAFWHLFLAYFSTAIAAYAVLPHSVAYLVEHGFSKIVAASAFGFTGVMSVAGILSMGWLSDRFGRVPTALGSYVMTLAGIAALLGAGATGSIWLVYLFVLCFGLMQGARGPILVGLVAQIFRGGSIGAIFGALSLALGLGAGAGSWLSGALHTWSGDYTWSFLMAMVAVGVGMATFGLSRSLRV